MLKSFSIFGPLKSNRMKNLWTVFILIGLLGCQQEKMGYVDHVRLMENNKEKIDIEAKYKQKSTVLSKKRDSISQAFQLEAQELQKEIESMSQQKAQQEYDLLQQRGQFIGQQLQNEEQLLQQQGQAEMDSLVRRVKDEIKDFGKANGYTYILTAGEGGSVLYGKENHDLTDQILKIINDKYGK